MKTTPDRILLVANPGGHLLQMLALEGAWEGLDRRWVTLVAADSKSLLAQEDVIYANGPTARNLMNLVRNVAVAWQTIRRFDPDVILSTGAALAIPFFIVGRLHGKRLVYVESFTRVSRPSLSGRIVYPLTNAFFMQWNQSRRARRALYAGSLV